MIDSSLPIVSRSRIELDRVRKNSGRDSGPRRRRRAIRASWVALSSPCSSISMTRTVGPSVSSPASRLIKASEIVAPSSTSQASVRSTRDFSAGSRASCALAAAPPSANRSRPRNAAPGNRFSDALGQSRLAAAQRTDDVVQRADVLQFKPFAAPGPRKVKRKVERKVERDAEAGGRSQQLREFGRSRSPPAGEVGPQAADFIDRIGELMKAAFQRGLVRSKCRFKTLRSRLPARAPPGRG